MALYADIILPLAQPAYTFSVPEGMELEEGCAVAVQFGAKKIYCGIVSRLHDRHPDVGRVKPVQRKLYNHPLLDKTRLDLWRWIADYYLSTEGEVMRCGLPSLMKPSADTEEAFLEEEFQPRTERYYVLSEELTSEKRFNEVCEKMERRAPRQYAALLQVASVGGVSTLTTREVARRLLEADSTTLQTLVKKGFLTFSDHERTSECGESRFLLPTLSEAQERALDTLRCDFATGRRCALLHGITGSGKTEIYIHLIAETLARGGGVLFLVPEIALTAQLIARMERIFSSRVTAYHSRLTNQRRAENFLRLSRAKGGELVVGARSALFLPIRNLQLVVVDEEHDASYKQADPAPRYNARDTAVMLAHLSEARVLLGSATPSLETWINATSGKYGLATLKERYGDAQPPKIHISDTLRAAKRGERRSHFNKLLLDKMEATLARGEQVMLFQNRRGFSPYVACTDCGWTGRCPQCNVSLTLHKRTDSLVCHYCGHTEPVPKKCPACRVADITPMGFGTEKVEEQIASLFPEARIARLDRDVVTSERATNNIIDDFEAHRTDILVGTQMITKGFDFGGVGLVGILNADNILHNTDFRAAERAFQLMMQVAGRAGRRGGGGEVVIQTTEPGNPLLEQIRTGDFEAMATTQLAERQAFFYPPYARLVSLTLRHSDVILLRGAAQQLSAALVQRFGRRLLGPITPPVDRIRGEFLLSMLLKIESGASFSRARNLLREELATFAKDQRYKSVTVVINVDTQ